MIEIKSLFKQYGKFTAVNGLNLTIPDDCIYGLVGPNGAGKTTTMKIMAGLLTATGGSVEIGGIDVIKSPKALREKIGYMPDFFGVYDNLKVDEYMDFYAGAYYIPYEDRPQLIDNLLDIVDLADKKHTYVDSLSRGMKQRLCLARSLIHDPAVLILDEPASGLDPRARVEMKEILKQLRSLGKTVIISSHILTELAELCTEVGIVDKGQVVACGPLDEIMKGLSKSRTVYIRPLEKKEDLVRLLEEQTELENIIENVQDVEFSYNGTDRQLAELLKAIVAQDIPLISFKEKEGNLEEAFMELTGDDVEGGEANA